MHVRELKAKIIRLDQLRMGNDFVVEALSESFALRSPNHDKNIASALASKLAHSDLILSRADQMMIDDPTECTDAAETMSFILFSRPRRGSVPDREIEASISPVHFSERSMKIDARIHGQG